MLMYFPSWLRHGRPSNVTSVFSVDMQPYGTRMATCGQDCAIKIWDTRIISEEAIKNNNSINKSDTLEQTQPQVPIPKIDKTNDKLKAQIAPNGALLTTLTTHTAAVNVVRWSPNGKYLASAGDDAIILLHYLISNENQQQQSTFGMRSNQQLETWIPKRPLRSHNSDIHDLAWSPDNQRLASASVDNSIIIWNIKNEIAIIRLEGHTGYVKGVSWDPVGRYIISQSDDRSVRIWRSNDWKCEKIITQPFETAVFQENSLTFFLRICWSPCGNFFIATNAYRKPNTHHAPMFSRSGGFDDQPIEFVGHREPVISSRFSPRLYRAYKSNDTTTETSKHNTKLINNNTNANNNTDKTNNNTNTNNNLSSNTNNPNSEPNEKLNSSKKDASNFYTVLSLGSKDGGCSIWPATAQTPFITLYDAFDMEVIDISWGTDGYTMAACSPDGKILYAKFEPSELGEIVPLEESRKILIEQWRSLGGKASSNGEIPLPESAVQLNMEEVRQEQDEAQKKLEQQQQQQEHPKPPKIARMNSASNVGPSNTGTPSSFAAPFSAAAEAVRQNGPTPPADPKLMAAQAEVRVRGGKRRITPVSINTNSYEPTPVAPIVIPVVGNAAGGGATSFQPMPIEVSETVAVPNNNNNTTLKRPRSNGSNNDDGNEIQRTNNIDSTTAAKHPNTGSRIDGALGAFARNESTGTGGTGLSKSNMANANGLDNKIIGANQMGTGLRADQERYGILPPGAQPVSHAANLYAPSVVGLSMMLLPERGNGSNNAGNRSGNGIDQSGHRGRCRLIRKGDQVLTLESRELQQNNSNINSSGYIITCSKGGKVKWKDYHTKGGAITGLAGVYGKFVAAATSDGILFLYSSSSGRRLVPPVVLDSAPYMLETFCFGNDDDDNGNNNNDIMMIDIDNPTTNSSRQPERWFALVITRSAMCTVYDVKNKKMICARSAACLLARPREMDGMLANSIDGLGLNDGDNDMDDNDNNNNNTKSGKNKNKNKNNTNSNANNNNNNNNGKSNNNNGGNANNRAKIIREVAHCDVSKEGEPILTLSDGHAFVYCREMCSWIRIADDSLPNSEYKRTLSIHDNQKLGLVRYLQSKNSLKQGNGNNNNHYLNFNSISSMGDLKRAAIESLSHLECLMESSIVLQCAEDYRYYLTNYASCIASAVNDDVESCTLRLREVCDELLNYSNPNKKHLIIGMNGRELLKNTVLPVVSKNRHLQRFVVEYNEALKEIEAISTLKQKS